jgi:hypothetical protein
MKAIETQHQATISTYNVNCFVTAERPSNSLMSELNKRLPTVCGMPSKSTAHTTDSNINGKKYDTCNSSCSQERLEKRVHGIK